MNKMKTWLILLFFTVFLPRAQAGELKMIFFYPGGQGSQEQAQPLLDSFSEALAKASGGKIHSQVTYVTDPEAGKQFIQQQKPAAGILSVDLYEQEAPAGNLKILAQTLQIPYVDGTDQYFLVGRAGAELPGSGKIQAYSSRAIDPAFVKKNLFPKLELEIQPSPNVVGKLRKIGKGEENGWVLLDAFEYNTISRSRSPWAQNLKAATESPKVPSAPFVVFANRLSPEESRQLQEALLKMGKDPEAKETLGLLRLKGFRSAP